MAAGDATKPVLAYWNIRAIAEPIRYMLEYIEKPYENKVYNFVENVPLEKCRAEWLKERNTLGLEFPNLPYYMDGDLKMTQSLAIMRHLARKHRLYAQDDAEETQQDVLECQINDFRWNFIKHCKADTSEALSWNYADIMHGQLKLFSDYLGKKMWLLGDRLTYVDFMLYEALDQHALFEASCLDDFSNLKAYHERFRNLPAIKAYLESERFKAWPVLGVPAKRWGWKKATADKA